MRLYTEEEKSKRVKRELARLRRLFKDLPKDKKQVAEGLMAEAAFMRATLEETRHIIDKSGVMDLFEQGKQFFWREHPATKVYTSLVNRYTAVCKQLFDLLPEGDKSDSKDALMEFVKAKRRA